MRHRRTSSDRGRPATARPVSTRPGREWFAHARRARDRRAPLRRDVEVVVPSPAMTWCPRPGVRLEQKQQEDPRQGRAPSGSPRSVVGHGFFGLLADRLLSSMEGRRRRPRTVCDVPPSGNRVPGTGSNAVVAASRSCSWARTLCAVQHVDLSGVVEPGHRVDEVCACDGARSATDALLGRSTEGSRRGAGRGPARVSRPGAAWSPRPRRAARSRCRRRRGRCRPPPCAAGPSSRPCRTAARRRGRSSCRGRTGVRRRTRTPRVRRPARCCAGWPRCRTGLAGRRSTSAASSASTWRRASGATSPSSSISPIRESGTPSSVRRRMRRRRTRSLTSYCL